MSKEILIDPSMRFECLVPQSVLDNFRRAVFLKHKKFRDCIGIEVTRALSLHAERMLLEAGNHPTTPGVTQCEAENAEPPGFVDFAGLFDGTGLEEGEEE